MFEDQHAPSTTLAIGALLGLADRVLGAQASREAKLRYVGRLVDGFPRAARDLELASLRVGCFALLYGANDDVERVTEWWPRTPLAGGRGRLHRASGRAA